MAIFRKIKQPKGCNIKYTAAEILAAYPNRARLETVANQVVEDLFLCPYFESQVAGFVKNNGGKQEDVEDFIQESLFVLKHNLLKRNYKGADITAYTIGIARNSWLTILNKKKRMPIADMDEKRTYLWSTIKDTTPNQEEWRIIQEEEKGRSHLLSTILKNCLSEKQIQLLVLKYLQRFSYEEITEQLDYKSSDAAKNAAMDARKKLKKCIHANPSYADLLTSFNL